MRKRMRKKISGFLAFILVLQCFCTTSLFADEIAPAPAGQETSVSSEAPASDSEAKADPVEEAGPETPALSDDKAEKGTEDSAEPVVKDAETSENTAPADTAPADTASENGLSENTVSGDSPSGNSVSLNGEEEESAGAVQDKKAVTVMLYQVGCDLERNSLAARSDLMEIMKGIDKRTSKATLAPSINFVVETGGMDGKNSMDGYKDLIADRYGALKADSDANPTDPEKKLDFENFAILSENVTYTTNQRWLLSGNNIFKAETQPTNANRPMNEALGSGLNEELKEFIDTTTSDYPADQYVLIFWDHGGGSNGGCGNDERKEGSIKSDNIRATMPETKVFGEEKKKLAWIGYDACLMANLETALIWKDYARFFSGSEELEGNDGWSYTGFVTELCDAAANTSNDFSNDNKVDEIIGKGGTGVGPTAVADFVDHYTEGNATQTFVDLSKIDTASREFAGYANEFIKLFEDYPVDTYRAIRQIRTQTESFMGKNPPLADIRSFTEMVEDGKDGLESELKLMGLTGDQVSKYYDPVKKQGEKLRDAIAAAVVSENHTDEYGDLGGLTVFFPYASVIRDKQGSDDVKSYMAIYNDETVLEPYLDLLGLYYSVRMAGDDLSDGNKTKSDIEETFKNAMADYEVSKRQGDGRISSVPEELISHRIQNEAIKIARDGDKYSLVRRDFNLFSSFNQHLVLKKGGKELFLGYLPGGDFTEDKENRVWKQDLYNYDSDKWFGVSANGESSKLPVPLYYVDVVSGSNALTDKAEIMVPVLGHDGSIYFLDVAFEKGEDQGKVRGMWPYAYEYNQLGRYIYNEGDAVTAKMPFVLVGNVLESTENRSGVDFDPADTDTYAYGEIKQETLDGGAGYGFIRNIPLTDFSGGNYTESFISNELKDVFDSSYFYGNNPSYREELKVSVGLGRGVFAFEKGSELKTSDLRIVLKNSAGNEVSHNTAIAPGQPLLYCLHDDNNEEIPIFAEGGYLYGKYNDGDKKIVVDKDLTVYLKKDESVSFNNYSSIDFANTTLEQSFSLKVDEGGDSVTLKVYDPKSDQLSITVLSRPLYYLDNYLNGLNKDNYADYFKVEIKDIDVTNDTRFKENLRFGYKRENASSWTFGSSLPTKNLKPGAGVAIDIKYDSLSANSTDNPLVIRKTPAKLKGTEPVRTARLEKLKTEYKGPIEVSFLDADEKTVTDVPPEYTYKAISDIFKEDSALITTKGIDNTISYNYVDLPLTAKGDVKAAFGDLFEIREFLLSDYAVYNVTSVRFLSSTDRKALSTAIRVPVDTASKDGRIAVSAGSVPISGKTPIEWYYKSGTAYPVVVYRDGGPVAYGKIDLVERNKKGEWSFYIPDDLNGRDVVFYAGYGAEAKNEGDIEVLIDPITPVEYTGRNIVTTKSTKTGSKVLGLVVRTSDGQVELVEGIDYTVSYRNNKNVSDAYDRKPPTLILTGKNAYKGLKYTINFTILPADLANAYISVDRRYAPLNSNKKKGVTLVTTVTLPGGTKVPTNRYELHFYKKDQSGLRTEVTRAELTSLYKTDKVYPLYISAKAIQPADQGSNFVTGSWIDPQNEAFVYAYPKMSSKISVALKTRSYEYSEEGQKIDDIFAASNIKTLKAGGKTVSLGQIEQPVEAYYDKNLTQRVDSDVLKNAGTYYLSIALNDTAKAQYRVFNATPLKVDITGTKLTRSNIVLMDKSIVAVSGNAREPVSLPLQLRFASDFKWTTLLVRCTQRDGGTVDYTIHADDPECFEENGMVYYDLEGVDNGAIGTYKVTVYGSEEYSGNVTYSYKVVAK